MEIRSEFKEAVQNKDMLTVRLTLKNSMWRDPTFEQFNLLIAYAEKNLSNLYDNHDGELFPEDKSKWTFELLDLQLAICIDNFSRERLLFLRRLCRYLYTDKIKKIENERRMESLNIKKANDERKKYLMAGGAVTAAGLIAGSTIITVAGAAVVVYTLVNKTER